MSLARVSNLVLVLLCVAALGTAAASLDSTVATEPDDVLAPEWRQLPLSEDEAGDIKDEIQANERAAQGSSGQAPRPSDGPKPDGQGDTVGEAAGIGSGPGEALAGMGDAELDRLDRLLALLRALLPVLLAAIAVVTVTGLGYRYRYRIAALAKQLVGLVWWPFPASARGSSPQRGGGFEPEHAVDRAWLRLVSELDPDAVRYLTPSECARSAKASGLPPAAVDAVRATFEEVRYGGKPVTDDRRQRVRECLHSLGLEGGPR